MSKRESGEKHPRRGSRKFRFPIPLPSPRLSTQEQALFARRLSLLIKAGVPLLESLEILRRQMPAGRAKRFFDQIIDDISNGQFLSKSLARRKRFFSPFTINLIKIGESSGTLSTNLAYLAEELDKERELRRKIVSAMIYPAVVMVASLAIATLLTVFLFPKLLPVFKSLNVALPFTTRALIWISNFLISYGIWLLAGLAVFIIVWIILGRIPKIRLWMQRTALTLPVFGSLLQFYQLTNLCRTYGLLLKGGVNVLEATKITSETTTNLVYGREFDRLSHAIIRGANISSYLVERPRLFPHMLTETVAIGERTGNLSDMLVHLSSIYEQEFEERTKRLTTLIEPALMIFMGVIVGFISISIITPIYEVTQHLTPTR